MLPYDFSFPLPLDKCIFPLSPTLNLHRPHYIVEVPINHLQVPNSSRSSFKGLTNTAHTEGIFLTLLWEAGGILPFYRLFGPGQMETTHRTWLQIPSCSLWRALSTTLQLPLVLEPTAGTIKWTIEKLCKKCVPENWACKYNRKKTHLEKQQTYKNNL